MMNYLYFPIIKTRDAEIKALSKLDASIFKNILPIFELTKSRKTQKTPDGDIHKKMLEIKKIAGDSPFILDLSTNKNYINPQIETLLSPDNGYYEWVYFLNSYSHLNIIPMVHLYDDEDFTDVEAFVDSPYIRDKHLAVRIPYNEIDIHKFISPIVRRMSGNILYVIIDVGQVILPTDDIVNIVEERIREIEKTNYPLIKIIVTSTSFPRLVGKHGEFFGEFPIKEELIYQKLKIKNHIFYGDYASINIEQIEMKGGGFIPRIDVSLEEKFFYDRRRRNAGSYVLCAQNILKNKDYENINTWADDEIAQAASGTPSGISPSFWIAVRMNYFITKRVSMRILENL